MLHFNISGLPVIDKDKKPIGIISMTDIIKFLDEKLMIKLKATTSTTFLFLELINLIKKRGAKDIKEILRGIEAKNIMKKKVIKINENEEIEKAIELMNKYDVSRIIVVDDEGKLSGIITKTDILKFLLKE